MGQPKESFLLKKSYMKTPSYKSITSNQISNNIWIFENLYNDYISISNNCHFLENYFFESFDNFKKKISD